MDWAKTNTRWDEKHLRFGIWCDLYSRFYGTVRCCYNAVNFLPNPYNKQPIACTWWRDMGCLLWLQYLIYVLLLHCSAVCNIMIYSTALLVNCKLPQVLSMMKNIDISLGILSWRRKSIFFIINDTANSPHIAKFMGPTWGPPGSCRPQMGPMLAPWTLLSGSSIIWCKSIFNHEIYIYLFKYKFCHPWILQWKNVYFSLLIALSTPA